MILDGQLQFSDGQAVTVTAASTNQVDLGPTYLDQKVDLGVGEELYIFVNCEETMADVGSDATVTVTLETDADPLFGSPTVAQTIGTFPAVSVAGTKIAAKLQPLVDLEKYIQVKYTVANGPLTAGKFSAHMTKDIDAYKNYKNAYIVS